MEGLVSLVGQNQPLEALSTISITRFRLNACIVFLYLEFSQTQGQSWKKQTCKWKLKKST